VERKLRKCATCREWFNATTAVMVKHYEAKHQFDLDKMSEVLRLASALIVSKFKAISTPWPMCMQYMVEFEMINHQIQRVIAATNKGDSHDKGILAITVQAQTGKDGRADTANNNP